MTAEMIGQQFTAASNSECAPTAVKKMGMFLQDPSLPKLHDNYDFPIDDDYLRGTGSSRVVIQDTDESGSEVFSSLNWATEPDLSFEHFETQGLADNPQFHQVNTFAVVNRTLDFVEEEIGHKLIWKDGAALIVRPHAFEGMNAYYDPQSPSLNFGYFTTLFRRTPVWVCLSHDVVTHELGHAILDTFRPLYILSTDLDTSALHESFADLMAMFSALQYKSLVKHLFRETHGDMRDPSLISRLAEEFGLGIFGAGVSYLRSALEGPDYATDTPKEPHARSTIWTAAIYEILERLIQEKYPTGFDRTVEGFGTFSEALVNATRWLKGMLLRALHYTPPNSLTMPMLARLMYEADARVFPTDSRFRDIAKEVFQKRKIWNDALDLSLPDASVGQSFQGYEGVDPATLSRLIIKHADALRIPDNIIRLLQPRLITTTRQVDTVNEGGACSVKTITEHYLEFSYEQVETVDFSGLMIPFVVNGGGTLILDENWNAGLLATYPEILKEDPPAAEGTKLAWSRARDRFDAVHGSGIEKTLAARAEKRTLNDRPVVAGCPFILQRMETGAYRLVRRNCNYQEHIKGLCFTKHGIVRP